MHTVAAAQTKRFYKFVSYKVCEHTKFDGIGKDYMPLGAGRKGNGVPKQKVS